MKVIIAGSRDVADYTSVLRGIAMALGTTGWRISEVVCGGARGVDMLGARWADDVGVPVAWFHADWTNEGKKAGIVRNAKMAKYGDALIAIWDGKSRGTFNMIEQAKFNNLPVYVHNLQDEEEWFLKVTRNYCEKIK